MEVRPLEKVRISARILDHIIWGGAAYEHRNGEIRHPLYAAIEAAPVKKDGSVTVDLDDDAIGDLFLEVDVMVEGAGQNLEGWPPEPSTMAEYLSGKALLRKLQAMGFHYDYGIGRAVRGLTKSQSPC